MPSFSSFYFILGLIDKSYDGKIVIKVIQK